MGLHSLLRHLTRERPAYAALLGFYLGDGCIFHVRAPAPSCWRIGRRTSSAPSRGGLLRGLFHSDGARVKNWATRVVNGERRRYEHPRWQFSNRSEDILDLCSWALDASIGLKS